MIKKLTIALAGAATATALLLTGCSGSGQAGAGAPVEQPTGSAAAPSTPGGDSSTPAAESSAPSEESSKDSGSGQDSSGKPAKDEIVTGLAKYYQESQGQPAGKAKNFAACMVDEMYDKAKPVTLEAMRDGQPAKADSGDAGLFAQAGMACAKHLS